MKKLLLGIVLSLLTLIVAPQPVMAGTNLTVTCNNNGPCPITPGNTPLFNETNLAPGNTRSQTLTITNNDLDDTCGLFLDLTDQTTGQSVNLANRMFAAITDGVTNYYGNVSGGQAVAGTSYQDLYNAPLLSLGNLSPGATRTYTWYGTFDPTAGNEYQGVQTVFDFTVGITCASPASPTPTPSPSNNNNNNNGGGGGGGGGGSGQPQVCTEATPNSAPVLTITNVGTNTVSLQWTAVAPVTHYALVFTRTSDGAQYGSPNIGNVTSYTVTNLSGGANYTFEIFGVNGCAPGARSNTPQTGIVPGAFIESRPLGTGGQVLGASTEASPSPSPTVEPSSTSETNGLGQVAGAVTEACSQWRLYIPWILLVIQLLAILLSEYYFKRDSGNTKHFTSIGLTLVSIAIFYWIRECDCYNQQSFLAWLCKWYWVVSLLVTALVRAFSYAFLEETEALEKKKVSPQLTDKPSSNPNETE